VPIYVEQKIIILQISNFIHKSKSFLYILRPSLPESVDIELELFAFEMWGVPKITLYI